VKLIVIIPAFNEEATIGKVIGSIPRQIEGIDEVHVMVADDGSTDRTGEIAAHAGATVISHLQNLGVGAAFRTGIRSALEAGADIIVNMDGDGQFNPEDIPQLLQPILDGEADMTTCTRFARRELVPDMSPIRKWGNRMMCRLIKWICWGKSFTDVSCGFRAYRRDIALQLTLFGDFTYTQESFIDMIAKGFQIKEIPLQVRGRRQHGKSRVAGNLWRYAVRSAGIIILAARDIRPLIFFGSLGVILLALGITCGGVVFGWWLSTGGTSPFRSLLIGSAVFLILGFLMIVLALQADMMGRHRKLMEEILYASRRTQLERKPKNGRQKPEC
jgi:glycosyltransferase involved in cell wall biosynthesis